MLEFVLKQTQDWFGEVLLIIEWYFITVSILTRHSEYILQIKKWRKRKLASLKPNAHHFEESDLIRAFTIYQGPILVYIMIYFL